LGICTGGGVSGVVHHPKVLKCRDGRWVVRCPECERPGATEILIGIGAPVESQEVAHMIRNNHLAKQDWATFRYPRRPEAQPRGRRG